MSDKKREDRLRAVKDYCQFIVDRPRSSWLNISDHEEARVDLAEYILEMVADMGQDTASPESPTSFDESVVCKHPDAYNRTKYEGDKLVSGTGYCRDCEQTWVLNAETRKFEPTQSPQGVSDDDVWKKVSAVIGETIGLASMCWEPRPSGVFDSSLAQKAWDDCMKQLKPRLALKFMAEGETTVSAERLSDLEATEKVYRMNREWIATAKEGIRELEAEIERLKRALEGKGE